MQVRQGEQKGAKKRKREEIANNQVGNNQVWELSILGGVKQG